MQAQALPAAVRRQIEKGNKAAEAVLAAQKGAPAPQAAPAPNGANGKPTNPSPAAAPPSAPAPAPAPAAAAPQAAPAPAPAPAGDDWEQRYKVLQGKYNAEVPRLQKQVNDQTLQLNDLNGRLLQMQSLIASLGPNPQQPPQTPAAPRKMVKDEEVKEFGADLTDFMRRVALETVLPEVDARVSKVVQPVAQRAEGAAKAASAAQQRAAQSDEQKVLDLLAREVPDWETMDSDEGFLAWLDQVDPFSNEKRGDLLNRAYAAHDGPRVVRFFKSYLTEHAAVQPPIDPAQPAAPAPGAPQVQLGDLVAPGTPKGTAGTQAGAEKRIWTRADIKAFYAAKNSNFFRGKEDEMKRLEADIFAAQRENRIR